MLVTLKKDALVTIVSSAIEVYPKEVFGTVFGELKDDGFNVNFAIPYQLAKRKKEEVEFTLGGENSIDSVVEKLSGQNMLGTYHSHTKINFNDFIDLGEPSKYDLKHVISSYFFGFVLAIKKVGHNQEMPKLPKSNKHIIVGSVSIYGWCLAAYTSGNDNDKNKTNNFQKLSLKLKK